MENLKYIDENLKAKLIQKGLSESDISKEIEKNRSQLIEFGYEGEDLNNMLNRKLKVYFSKIVNSTEEVFKAIVVAIGEPRDEAAHLRDYAIRNKGVERINKVDGKEIKYIVKEGCYSWGRDAGKPIPEGADWRVQGIIAIETKINGQDKILIKDASFQGEWIINPTNKLESMDVINFRCEKEKLQGKTIYINGTDKQGKVDEDTIKELLKTDLKPLRKTITQIVDDKLNGNFFVTGVDIISINNEHVEITDSSNVDANPNYYIKGKDTNINYVEGAMNVIMCINTYVNNKTDTVNFNVLSSIVPEKMRAIKVPDNAVSEIVEDSVEEVVEEVKADPVIKVESSNTTEVDDDLL